MIKNKKLISHKSLNITRIFLLKQLGFPNSQKYFSPRRLTFQLTSNTQNKIKINSYNLILFKLKKKSIFFLKFKLIIFYLIENRIFGIIKKFDNNFNLFHLLKKPNNFFFFIYKSILI